MLHTIIALCTLLQYFLQVFHLASSTYHPKAVLRQVDTCETDGPRALNRNEGTTERRSVTISVVPQLNTPSQAKNIWPKQTLRRAFLYQALTMRHVCRPEKYHMSRILSNTATPERFYEIRRMVSSVRKVILLYGYTTGTVCTLRLLVPVQQNVAYNTIRTFPRNN